MQGLIQLRNPLLLEQELLSHLIPQLQQGLCRELWVRLGEQRAGEGPGVSASPRGDPYLDGVVLELVIVFHLFEEIVNVFIKLSQLF